MRAAVRAGAAYFVLVFAAGFVLGAVRELFVAPAVGALAAVAVEVPLMLGFAWPVSAWLVARCAVPARAGARLAMGAVALALLIGGEALLAAALGTRWTPLESAAGRLGLAAQIVFALIPALQLTQARR